MERRRIEGLLYLTIHDGLPPNIKVTRIPVLRDWEGHLQVNPDWQQWRLFGPAPVINPINEETVQLEEFEIEGGTFLAGFVEMEQLLLVGWI